MTPTQLIPLEKRSALAVMANRFNCDPNKLLSTLKSTVFAKATDDELMALVIVANEYKLNPLLREIFAFPTKGGGIQPVVSVDGWIRIMNEHPQFDGMDFEEVMEDGGGRPLFTTCIVFRKDRTRPIRVTEWFSECVMNTDPWRSKPKRMLRHKAMIQAARIAFGFSGIMDEEDAETMKDVTPRRDNLAALGRPEPVQYQEPAQIQPQPAPTPEPAKRPYTRRAPAADSPTRPAPSSAPAAVRQPAPVEPEPAPEGGESGEGDPFAEAQPAAAAPANTPQQELAYFLTAEGITWSVFAAWAGPQNSGNVANVDQMAGFQDLSAEDCSRFMRARIGLLNMCRMVAKTMPKP
jgi:phage recombination protein Bet